jgi:predicted nuclease with TOPRIM domain
MVINIESELRAQLEVVNNTLTALEQESKRLQATLKLLPSEITLEDVYAQW